MPNEKPPLNPIGKNDIPENSFPYKVEDNDSWVTIARRFGLDAWELIYNNFRTRDPEEVNWYLHYFVGCRKQTFDKKNWIFTSDVNPESYWRGIIYIPKQQHKYNLPPLEIVSASPDEKWVLGMWIWKEVAFGTDVGPNKVKWGGTRYIIEEEYDKVPKDHVKIGELETSDLYYEATGFKRIRVRRNRAVYDLEENKGKVSKWLSYPWQILKFLAEIKEGGDSIVPIVYSGWASYLAAHGSDPDDPLLKCRHPPKSFSSDYWRL